MVAATEFSDIADSLPEGGHDGRRVDGLNLGPLLVDDMRDLYTRSFSFIRRGAMERIEHFSSLGITVPMDMALRIGLPPVLDFDSYTNAFAQTLCQVYDRLASLTQELGEKQFVRSLASRTHRLNLIEFWEPANLRQAAGAILDLLDALDRRDVMLAVVHLDDWLGSRLERLPGVIAEAERRQLLGCWPFS